jgi:competence ComEA-like helix-hairpin-helix protein
MKRRTQARRRRAFFSLLLAACALAASYSCVRLPRQRAGATGQSERRGGAPLVNINAASPAELERLPGIGRALAARIVAHRAEYGRFRKPEHLMMVRGVSDRRFRALRALIKTE